METRIIYDEDKEIYRLQELVKERDTSSLFGYALSYFFPLVRWKKIEWFPKLEQALIYQTEYHQAYKENRCDNFKPIHKKS